MVSFPVFTRTTKPRLSDQGSHVVSDVQSINVPTVKSWDGFTRQRPLPGLPYPGTREGIQPPTMQELTSRSSHVLLRVSSLFPFDLFPDELIVDAVKVSMVRKNFFSSHQVYSLLVKDIADVTAEIAGFFGTVKITDIRFRSDPIAIRFLKKDDALHARRVIQGLLLLRAEGVGATLIPIASLRQLIETTGGAHTRPELAS